MLIKLQPVVLPPYIGGQNNLSCAGSQWNGQDLPVLSNQNRMGPSSDAPICRLPSLIAGPRCYSDASIAPNTTPNATRPEGLGFFFLHPIRQLKCYIKARTEQANSVLMAETAAMALAARIISLIGIREISFLTDNQLLAFFNGASFEAPPHWDIKPFSQNFLNVVEGYN
jgi:hypothetical protein